MPLRSRRWPIRHCKRNCGRSVPSLPQSNETRRSASPCSWPRNVKSGVRSFAKPISAWSEARRVLRLFRPLRATEGALESDDVVDIEQTGPAGRGLPLSRATPVYDLAGCRCRPDAGVPSIAEPAVILDPAERWVAVTEFLPTVPDCQPDTGSPATLVRSRCIGPDMSESVDGFAGNELREIPHQQRDDHAFGRRQRHFDVVPQNGAVLPQRQGS